MKAELLHIGFDNVVAAKRLVAILPGASGARGAFSSPTHRMISSAKDRGQLLDMTNGRRTKAVLVLDSGHVMLSAISPRTIVGRLIADRNGVRALAAWAAKKDDSED
ncbi:MAG: DUF370 domain-containing protein [Chloroflexi bacterium]|nr:DUF370 domain-containing protein [Chloroflexota bacterium]